MLILWLIILIIILTLSCIIIVLIYRHTHLKEKLFAVNQELLRTRARHLTAKEAARKAEANCQRLLGQVQTSINTTGQALNIAQQIETVSKQLSDLIGWITQPLDNGAGRHARTAEEELADLMEHQ